MNVADTLVVELAIAWESVALTAGIVSLTSFLWLAAAWLFMFRQLKRRVPITRPKD